MEPFSIRWIFWNLHPALSESIDFDDPRAPFSDLFPCFFLRLSFRTSIFKVFKQSSEILGLVFRPGQVPKSSLKRPWELLGTTFDHRGDKSSSQTSKMTPKRPKSELKVFKNNKNGKNQSINQSIHQSIG